MTEFAILCMITCTSGIILSCVRIWLDFVEYSRWWTCGQAPVIQVCLVSRWKAHKARARQPPQDLPRAAQPFHSCEWALTACVRGSPPIDQWMEGALTGPEEVSFFEDEWRNPVFVGDILRIIEGFMAKDRGALRAAQARHPIQPNRSASNSSQLLTCLMISIRLDLHVSPLRCHLDTPDFQHGGAAATLACGHGPSGEHMFSRVCFAARHNYYCPLGRMDNSSHYL